jgi:hypothetical protein
MSLLDSSYVAKHLFRTKVDIQSNVIHGGLLPFFRVHELGISYLSWKEVTVSSRRLNVAFFNLLSIEYQASIPLFKADRFLK